MKKGHGSQYVIMKQKDSDVKYVEFTPNRLVKFTYIFVCIRLDIYNLNSSRVQYLTGSLNSVVLM